MSVVVRQVTVIGVRCDFCHETENRSHEAKQLGSVDDFVKKETPRALESIPDGWARLANYQHVCPGCCDRIAKGRR